MAYDRKTWVDRESEFPNRRTLTAVSGSANTYDVTRAEGTVSVEGDAFDAENMNDLESRIAAGFTGVPENPEVVTVQTTTSWTSQSTTAGTEYWEQSVTVPGLGTSDQVDISLDADGLNQLLEDGVTALWAENTGGACVIKALGAAPTVALTLHLTLTEVSST